MGVENILVTFSNGVRKMIFNRPEKRNAFSTEMYKQITEILNQDAKNEEIVLTIITGTGEYYSSGNDIKDAIEASSHGNSPLDTVKLFIQAFIDYPKLLIAVVNGPAIGIAATSVALCDIIYATEKASFDTPFLKLGLCAEGTSSFTFPIILGRSKASEILFLNKKLSAQEAYQFGFISEIVPHEKLDSFIESLYKYGSLPINILKINKELVMRNVRKILTECNEKEIESLKKCVDSEEFTNIVMHFLNKNSKL